MAEAAGDGMRLRSLAVQGLRVLSDLEIDTDADLVVLTGPNGSGKTSILEAVHLLGTGRSFRSRTVQDVVARDAERVFVRGEVHGEDGRQQIIGVEKPRRGEPRMRIGGESVTGVSALARLLPLVLITPDSQRLLSDGAENRRRLLDWLLFHVEPTYQRLHARYRRALRQRNAALRAGPGREPVDWAAWCGEMAIAALALEQARRDWVNRVLPALEQALSRLSRIDVSLGYRPGWDTDGDLEAMLLADWDADRARGFSQRGPHRADLELRIHDRPAQHVASRGEAKVLAVSVHVAFAGVLASHVARRPLLLVDELASELDEENRARFATALRDLGLQTFVTAVTGDLVDRSGWERVVAYRMQGGKAAPMLQ